MALFGAVRVLHFVVEKAAEPVASAIQRVASGSSSFRGATVRLARTLDARDVRRHKTLFGGEQLVSTPLTEEEAVKKGADILGECVVWGVGLSVLLHQTNQEREAAEAEKLLKEKRREEKRRALLELEKRLVDRLSRLEDQAGARAECAGCWLCRWWPSTAR